MLDDVILLRDFMPLVCAFGGFALGCWELLFRPYLEGKKPFHELPMAPSCHWMFGHLKLITGDLDSSQRRIVDAANEMGRTGFWFGKRPGLSVSRWQDARAVLNSEPHREINPVIKLRFDAIMPNTVLGMNGRVWKHNRHAINRAFTPAALDSYTKAMVEVVDTICGSLKQRILSSDDCTYQCKIEKIMKMITMDAFGKTAFSKDFECTKRLQANDFVTAFDTFSRSQPTVAKPVTSDSTEAAMVIHKYVSGIVQERLNEESTEKEYKRDLLSFVIEAQKQKDGQSASSNDEVLRDVLTTVLFAGYDTTSITLTYALYTLSQNQDVTEKCLQEIARVCGGKDKSGNKNFHTHSASLENYEDLIYCRAVITETLRLFPPATATARTLQRQIKLDDGFVIPAGTQVRCPIWSIHRDERNFPRPLEFLPERWVRKDDSSDVWVERDPTSESDSTMCHGIPAGNPKAFFAFSGGGRSCPGMKFAWQEATIVLAGLVKNFVFEAIPEYRLTPIPGLGGSMQHPSDHVPMRIKLRKDVATISPQ